MKDCSNIRTPRPAKNFLFRVLADKLNRLGKVKSVCDVGSAECAFYPYFDCDNYFAYDIDIERPRSGLKSLNHHTISQEANYADITKSPIPHQGSLVFCIQVMIGNLSFDMAKIPESIENLVLSTELGGTLIFNIKSNIVTVNQVSQIVNKGFRSIAVVRYGIWNFRIVYPFSHLLGLLIYSCHKIGLPLPGNRYLFVCTGRQSS